MNNMNTAEVIRHAKMAHKINNKIYDLCQTGKIDLTQGSPWNYDLYILLELTKQIRQMETISVCSQPTEYNWCWTLKQVKIKVTSFSGKKIEGTLKLSRMGPGLDEYYWDFVESSE